MINFKVFLTLSKKIDKLLSNVNNDDLKDSLELVKEESKKQSWNKKLMTMGLHVMKGVANGFVVKGLMELVDKGISLLANDEEYENITYSRVCWRSGTLSSDALASTGKARIVSVLDLFEELQ